MWRTDPESRGHGLADEVFAGMKRWRTEHPTATWGEIEAALDERLAALRGRMLQVAAEASAAATLAWWGIASARFPRWKTVRGTH